MITNRFIFTADYGMGIGDFLIKLYAISHLNLEVKKNIKNTQTVFIIEEYHTKILQEILNIDLFDQLFDEFLIQNAHDQYVSNIGLNSINYKDKTYHRAYSAINDYSSNRRGYWEVYCDKPPDSTIDYVKFDYRDPSTRKSEPIPDLNINIIDSKFFDKALKFIKKNSLFSFDCIYYKTTGELNQDHLIYFIDKLKNYLNNNTNIFLTSNSELAKQIISSNIPKCVVYNNINTNNLDGYGTAHSDAPKINDLLTEMIIMSYANKIHYCGNYYYISLFNYYAHMVKKVPLLNYSI